MAASHMHLLPCSKFTSDITINAKFDAARYTVSAGETLIGYNIRSGPKS
jgi:hypothetical protein